MSLKNNMVFKAQTEWVKPTEFPDLRFCDEIAIDLETHDPDLKSMGTGSVIGKGKVEVLQLQQMATQVTFLLIMKVVVTLKKVK